MMSSGRNSNEYRSQCFNEKNILTAIAALSLLLTWFPWAGVKFSSSQEKKEFAQYVEMGMSAESLFGSSFGYMDSAMESTPFYKDAKKAVTVLAKAVKDGGLSIAEARSITSSFSRAIKSYEKVSSAMSMFGLGSDLEDVKSALSVLSVITFILFWVGLLLGGGAIYSIWTEKFKFARIMFTIHRFFALFCFLMFFDHAKDSMGDRFGLTFWAFLALLASFPAGFHSWYLNKLIPDNAALAMPAGMPSIPSRPVRQPVNRAPQPARANPNVAAPDSFKPINDLPENVKWLCTSCGTVNKGSSLYCESCGKAKPTFRVCPKCHKLSRTGGGFCASCGMEIPPVTSGLVCSSCGHENPLGSAFCEQCGTKL